MSGETTLELPVAAIREYCAEQPIQRLSLFGSALRGDMGPDSDVDLLVEYEPDAMVGFIARAGMGMGLSAVVGRHVDLRTPNELSRYFRDEVVNCAKLIYENESQRSLAPHGFRA